jgi:UPF0755 protein
MSLEKDTPDIIPKKSRQACVLLACYALLLTLFLALWLIWSMDFKPLHRNGEIIVPRGVTVRQLSRQLLTQRVIPDKSAFVWLARFIRVDTHLQAGHYRLHSQMTAYQLLQKIARGDVQSYSIRIAEGATWHAVREQLQANPHLAHQLVRLSDPVLVALLHVPYHSMEGVLFPDTYRFHDDTPDIWIVQEAAARMRRTLQQKMIAQQSSMTPYAVLIMASMLEKEAATAATEAHIAGILHNRLRKHMLLNVDVTLMYGLHLHSVHGLTEGALASPNPYNTYRHHGLPPTPIAFPSARAIDAALHPMHTKDFYYVAMPNGCTLFAQTYTQQQQLVKKMRAAQAMVKRVRR